MSYSRACAAPSLVHIESLFFLSKRRPSILHPLPPPPQTHLISRPLTHPPVFCRISNIPTADDDEFEVFDYVSKVSPNPSPPFLPTSLAPSHLASHPRPLQIASNLAAQRNDLSRSSWMAACTPYLSTLMDESQAEKVTEKFLKNISKVRRTLFKP